MASWYFQLMGETVGPLTSVELRERALSRQITAETLVTKDGTDRWVTANRVSGLLDPAASPVPPPAPQNTAAQTINATGNPEAERELIPMPVTGSATKEYKVLTQKDKWFSGKFDPANLEEALNAYAEQGWVVKAATTAAITGLMSGNRDEMIIILER